MTTTMTTNTMTAEQHADVETTETNSPYCKKAQALARKWAVALLREKGFTVKTYPTVGKPVECKGVGRYTITLEANPKVEYQTFEPFDTCSVVYPIPDGADCLPFGDTKAAEAEAKREAKRAQKAGQDAFLQDCADELESRVASLNEARAYDLSTSSVFNPQTMRKARTFKKPHTVADDYANIHVPVGLDKDGNVKVSGLGDQWLKHPNRLTYDAVVFDPIGGRGDNIFNLYEGWAVTPNYDATKQGFYLLDDHISNVICDGDAELYEYLCNWLAWVVQNLGKKSLTIPTLKSKEGTGKNMFIDAFRRLFGRHGSTTSRKDDLLGTYNGYVEDKLFIHLEEAFFSGDYAAKDAMKALVTNPLLTISNKFEHTRSDVPNYTNFMMSSNHAVVAGTDEDARRYVYIDVSNKLLALSPTDRNAYFSALDAHTKDTTVLSDFLGYLLTRPLGDFNPSLHRPKNSARDVEIRASWESHTEWVGYFITKRIEGGQSNSDNALAPSALYEAYLAYCDMRGYKAQHQRVTLTRFGSYLKKDLQIPTTGVKPRIKYDVANIDAWIAGFYAHHKVSYDGE